MRTKSLASLLVVVSLFLSVGAFAHSGRCCANKGAAAGAKLCCKKSQAKCPAGKAMDSLAKDLAVMKKGVPDADAQAFLDAHAKNLSAFLDACAPKNATCKGKKGKASRKAKACPHRADVEASKAALAKDLKAMNAGISAADRTAFLDAHAQNIQKFLDAKAECAKKCAKTCKKAKSAKV